VKRAWVYIILILCYIVGAGWQPVYNAHHTKLVAPVKPPTNLYGALQGGQGYIITPAPTASSREIPVKASQRYKKLLEEIEVLAENATEQIRFHDYKWKHALYDKILEAEDIAPSSLRKETRNVYFGLLTGLELMDKEEIQKTLKKIRELQQKIEKQD